MARSIGAAFQEPFDVGGRQVSVTASVGITVCPVDSTEPVALLNNADIAMYQAKEQGRNTFKFFTPSMHEEILSHHRIETDLKDAIARGQFELLYQPQFGLADHRIDAVEALLHWNHPVRGRVSSERSSSRWPRKAGTSFRWASGSSRRCAGSSSAGKAQACPCRAWRSTSPPFTSASPAFMTRFARVLAVSFRRSRPHRARADRALVDGGHRRHARMPARLEETSACGSRSTSSAPAIRASSYLRQFPLDVLKIDRSFVSDLDTSRDAQVICSAILSIAHRLSLDAVAEGIESEQQLAFLTRNDCQYGQGCYFSAPIEARRDRRDDGRERRRRPLAVVESREDASPRRQDERTS